MKTIKIFLASSSELKADREQFEIFISRENKKYVKDKIFLELILWEDFLDAMSQTRLQDEYNKAIMNCDVFVSLFYTKVGKYTAEEFEKAFKTFQDNNKPLIYTYFKDAAINTGSITSNIMSLLKFKEKLKELGHFQTNYTDINDLKFQFNNQITKFLPKLTGISPSKIQQNSDQINQAAPKTVQNFYGNVGSATGNVEGDQNIKNINKRSDRNISIGQGNYNENIQGDYIDQSRTQNISGGTINASGAGAFSLGDNYGTIVNNLNQVSDFDNSEKNELKQLLIQLQTTINQEYLDSEEKSEFREEIQIILKALPKSNNSSMKKKAKKSMIMLRGLAAGLSPTSETV
ncbi:MAG: hypothetical protein AAGA80_09340, partial [Cyanobacteria bacterium P01_F01_bin.143]